MSDADRIAALEAQVAALTARLDATPARRPAGDPESGTPIDRRAMLRRSGFAIAGLAAAPLLLAEPAAAATGNPVNAGATTSANDGDVTTITANNLGEPVLQVSNTEAGAAQGIAQPVVRLSSASAGHPVSAQVGDRGDIAISDDFFLNFAHTGAASGDTDVLWGNVYTSAYASFVEMLTRPRRLLDTRSGLGAPAAGKRDAGSELDVDLSDIVIDGIAVLGNLTVTEPEGSGFLATYPDVKPSPLTSSLNYNRAQTIANFTVVGLAGDVFTIYTSQRAHIVFDAIGLLVYDSGQTNPALTSAARRSRHRG